MGNDSYDTRNQNTYASNKAKYTCPCAHGFVLSVCVFVVNLRIFFLLYHSFLIPIVVLFYVWWMKKSKVRKTKKA